MLKKQKGYSYASILIALVIIQAISLTFVASIVTTNNSTNKSNNVIVGTQLADSYLDLAEVKITNSNAIRNNEEAVNSVYQSVKTEIDAFNASNERFDLGVFFQCSTNCSTISDNALSSNEFPLGDDFIEVTITVTHKSSKVMTSSETETFHLNRLVTIP